MNTRCRGKHGRLSRGVDNPTEDEEQKALVKWMTLKNILFYHIPNGGYRSKSEAARFKALGVQAGVPDICIPMPKKGYSGLYIELKRRKGGKLSEEQVVWLSLLGACNYQAVVAYGWDEAREYIEEYLNDYISV